MEDIKKQPYDDIHNPPEYTLLSDIDTPEGYEIDIAAVRLDKGNGTDTDTGIQKITIIVYHNNKPIITSGDYTLEDYKVDR